MGVQVFQVISKDSDSLSVAVQFYEAGYCWQEQTESDEPGSGAEELLPGIGVEKIRIHDRILFHRDARVFNGPECYDFAYRKDGLVKLVKISWNGTRVYSIPQEVFAELYVVQRMQLCAGVTEDILIKVIDNTDIERAMLGNNEHYNEFFRFIEKVK